MRDGRADLFATGVYLDRIRDDAGSLRFAERLVVCDEFRERFSDLALWLVPHRNKGTLAVTGADASEPMMILRRRAEVAEGSRSRTYQEASDAPSWV